MTVIAGIETPKGTVLMGADSCSVGNEDIYVLESPKVFINGEYALGFCGSWRMGQIIRFSFTPPSVFAALGDVRTIQDEDLLGFMVNRFVPRLRDTFEREGFDWTPEGWQVMVGVRGCLFVVERDFCVSRTADGFAVAGDGGAWALGALAAVPGTPTVRLIKALDVAEHFCHLVRRPFNLVEV